MKEHVQDAHLSLSLVDVCVRSWIYHSMTGAAPLPSQLTLVLIAPTHGGMARLG